MAEGRAEGNCGGRVRGEWGTEGSRKTHPERTGELVVADHPIIVAVACLEGPPDFLHPAVQSPGLLDGVFLDIGGRAPWEGHAGAPDGCVGVARRLMGKLEVVIGPGVEQRGKNES